MPGNTENTDILTGLNQVVEAINSLNKPTETDGLIENLNEIASVLGSAAAMQSAIVTNLIDLTSAIQALNLSCNTTVTINCGESGSRGAGQWPADPSPQDDTPEAQAGPPPEGFDSWAEYHQYKCDMGYYIINEMIGDIATTGVLAAGLTSATVLAPLLVGALLTPIGWAILITMAGLVIQLLIIGLEVATLTQLLEDNKDDLVCAMFSGDDVSGSIFNYSNSIDTFVEENTTISALGSVGIYLAKQYFHTFATTDSFNRLYNKVPHSIPEGNDCSACDEEETGPYTVLLGDETSDNPANPIAGIMQYNEFQAGCGTDEREFQINFHQAVTITNVTNTGSGACGFVPIHNYFANEDFTSLITQLNGRPQDTSPVSGVRSMYVVVDGEGGDPTIAITYTLD